MAKKKPYQGDLTNDEIRQMERWTAGNDKTGGLPISGEHVEQFIKEMDSRIKVPVDEVNKDEKENPPSSAAVAGAIAGLVKDISVDDSGDIEYVMNIVKIDENGNEVQESVTFQKYSDDDKVIIDLILMDADGNEIQSSQYLNFGSSLAVAYSAVPRTVGGAPVSDYSDLKARVILKRGNTTLSEFENAQWVSIAESTEYSFDATEFLTNPTTYTIQVEAQMLHQGTTIRKTVSARVTMVEVELNTTFSVGACTETGGYSADLNIPFIVKGTSGEKNLYYRMNGGERKSLSLSSGSTQNTKYLTLPLDDLTNGKNYLEAYVLHEDSGVMSRVYYITLLKAAPSVTNYVGLMFSHISDGFQQDYRNPVVNAEQFSAWTFNYAGWQAESNRVDVLVKQVQGQVSETMKSDVLQRGSTGYYGKTNVSTEQLQYEVVCGEDAVSIGIDTSPYGGIEAVLTEGADCTFDAFGRSNSESNKDRWASNGKYMVFENVLWSVNENGVGSGWNEDRLVLSNGARMTLTSDEEHTDGSKGYLPLNEQHKPNGATIRELGMTIEIEYSTANVTDSSAELITCLGTNAMGNRFGIVVTADEAKFLTGTMTEAQDGEDTIEYEDTVGTRFEPGKTIKVAFVFYPNSSDNEQRSLIGFYVNGEESAASKWLNKVNFNIMDQLVFNSVGADLLVKSIRIYNFALSNDQLLDNYIVDRNHLEDTYDNFGNLVEQGVRSLDEDNRVCVGGVVTKEKLMSFIAKRKNSILVLYGSGSVDGEQYHESDTLNIMDALAQRNDKKADKVCQELQFYNGENRDYDFILRDANLRIQGTSSVNYSRKNLRIYFQKSKQTGKDAVLSYGEIDALGVQNNPRVLTEKERLFYPRANSIGTKLACPKCDFSDSSMTTNTGGAKFINDGLKAMGLMTPAQKYAEFKGSDLNVRAAIDGLPCDLFVAKSKNDELVYYGQYNINNDKSESYPAFGQDKTICGDKWGEGATLQFLTENSGITGGEEGSKEYIPIAIETLNNTNDLCLFHWLPSTDANHDDFMDNNFDDGFELNHPKDTFWNGGLGDADEEPNMKDHLGQNDIYDKMYKSIDRMMGFIYECVRETTAGANIAYNAQTHTFSGVDYSDTADGKFPFDLWQSQKFRNEAHLYFDVNYCLAYYMYVDFNLAVDQLAKNMLVRTWDGMIWYTTYYDGDCQLGSDNKSFLTGKYDDGRETMRDGSYVMQGHNSWLWNLFIANFQDRFRTLLTTGINGKASFMSAFSPIIAVNYFDKEQMGKWCSRLYNKSGVFKYIYPYLNVMPGVNKTYAQVYGMKGSMRAHRSFFISERYALKNTLYGYYPSNGSLVYSSNKVVNKRPLADIVLEVTKPSRFLLTASNNIQVDSGVIYPGTEHTMQFLSANFGGSNDPLNLIGCENVRKFTWHEDAFSSTFSVAGFTSLVKLDMSIEQSSGDGDGVCMQDTRNMILLEEMNMENNPLARNGDTASFASLDLTYQSRLRKLNVMGTKLETLTLATGAPIVELKLPKTLIALFLEDIITLTDAGLIFEDNSMENVREYKYRNTPGVNGWAMLERLHNAKQNGTGMLERFSIDIDMSGDAEILERYFNYKTYRNDGGYDDLHSGLRGTYRLTKYISDEDFARYTDRYNSLTITQPEYTEIMFDDSVGASANISNLDNLTGYEYDKTYQPSGHINKILSMRRRVLAKKTGEGEVTVYPLHDENSNYYADAQDVSMATPAVLTGEEGDVMMFEPHYWYKGVNDNIRKKKYSSFSAMKDCPATTDCVKKLLGEIEVKSGYSIRYGEEYTTVAEAETAVASNSYCTVNVQGYRQVRYPSMPSAAYCAVFVDAEGTIVKRMKATSDSGLLDGMYCFTDIPANAVSLVFSISNAAPFDYVLLTMSEDTEAIEPDWVEHEECLNGVYEAYMTDDILYSRSGVVSTANVSQADFKVYARNKGKGFQLVDYEMHKDVANLFFAKYGERDAQGTCGPGTHTSGRTNGVSNATGMQDTKPTAKDGDPAPTVSGGTYPNGNAYVLKNPTDAQRTAIGSPVCMSYENWYGNKAEWTEAEFNKNKVDYKWRSIMPDGSEREIQEPKTTGDLYPKCVVHGRYMDIVVAAAGGSQTTNYFDSCYQSGSTARVVYRSNNFAYANGGVSYASSSHGSASVNAFIGSRLAFRGVIKWAKSVEEFKAIRASD